MTCGCCDFTLYVEMLKLFLFFFYLQIMVNGLFGKNDSPLNICVENG